VSDLHNALRRGPFAAAFTRALGLTKGVEGLERAGETLTPIVDLWARPEWAYLRREWLLARTGTDGPVAGEFTGVALLNPVGSGVLATVESAAFWAVGQSAGSLQRCTYAVALAALPNIVGRGISRDSRAWGVGLSPGRCLMYGGTEAGDVGARLEQIVQPTATLGVGYFQAAIPYVLTPGEALVCQLGSLNLTGTVIFGWRERLALPGELE